MKKINKFLFVFLFLGCVSCDNNQTNKINILTGDYTLTDFIELENSDSLNVLRNSKNDFIVYSYLPSCLTCSSFEIKLKSYIDDYGLTIYKINYNKLDKNDSLKVANGAPVLGFYKNGSALNITSYSESTKGIFESDSALKNHFEKYTILPTNYYISRNDLDKKILNKDTFVILFTRSSCPDCSSLFNNFLNEYMKENKNKTLYLLECDVSGIRLDENNEFNQTQWQQFKDDYHLSSSNTEEGKYGYLTGVVPTFQYYQNGQLKGSNVYANDNYKYEVLSTKSGEKGEQIRNYKITITESFISTLINKEYEYSYEYTTDENEKRVIYEYINDTLTSEHNESLKVFLNKYLSAK